MKTCYKIELRIKKMDTPDTSGNGPFTPTDSPEKGMKIMVYPELLDNPKAMSMVVNQLRRAYQESPS